MKFKKSIMALLIVFFTLVTGCSQKVLFDENDSKLLNYNFKISNLKNVDKTLSKQRYSYSVKNIDKKYIAVINYKSRNAAMNQYLVSDNETVNFTIPKGYFFAISLPANRTITATWNIKNSISNGVIKLKNRSWIEIPVPRSEKGTCGANYDRQNFYFDPLKSGNEKIVLRYERQPQQPERENTFFEITINVKIE